MPYPRARHADLGLPVEQPVQALVPMGQAAGGADFGPKGAAEGAGAADETTVEGEFREVGSER